MESRGGNVCKRVGALLDRSAFYGFVQELWRTKAADEGGDGIRRSLQRARKMKSTESGSAVC